MQQHCLRIALRWGAIEEVEMAGGMVLDAIAQYVYHATFADFGGESRQELEAVDVLRVAGVGHSELLEGFGLGGVQEGEELWYIERVGAVVILRATSEIAGAAVVRGRLGHHTRRDGKTVRAGHVAHDQCFEALLARIGAHMAASSSTGAVSSLTSISSTASDSSSSGNHAAASRTSSSPVTTSATRRVRYSRSSSISRSRREIAKFSEPVSS